MGVIIAQKAAVVLAAPCALAAARADTTEDLAGGRLNSITVQGQREREAVTRQARDFVSAIGSAVGAIPDALEQPHLAVGGSVTVLGARDRLVDGRERRCGLLEPAQAARDLHAVKRPRRVQDVEP